MVETVKPGAANLSRRAVTLVFVLLLAAGCSALRIPGGTGQEASNVILIVMDGARWSETGGDPRRENITFLGREMAARGVVYTNARNGGLTVTNPSHASMVTGFYEQIDNQSQLPAHPTLLQRFLAVSGLPKERAWLVTSKDKLRVLADCQDPEWHGKHPAAAYCGRQGTGPGYEDDKKIADKVVEVLSRDHPRLMVVNFSGVDVAGHAGNRDLYLAAIRRVDGLVREIFAAVDRDPFYRDRTAVFVVNDHGRHLEGTADGFRGHGCDCDGCRHVMLFAAGPGFSRGATVEDPVGLVDVAVTAASILGFDIPGSQGKAISGLKAGSARGDTR